ncbi:hypothetical protein LUZ60_014252 [Juncus effusus]|nr:hypothetical protein LUZ60_014252 [Juncus effusus]
MAAKSPSPTPTIELGAKGFSLSPSAVYSIAHALSHVEIDSSALDKLSQHKKKPSFSSSSSSRPSSENVESNPRFLPAEISRAAIAVFLNKLLLSDSVIRPSLVVLLQKSLSLPSGHEKFDFSSPSALLQSLAIANTIDNDVNSISSEEIGVFEASSPASVAICAILDCCSTALIRVSDAVAALSCEAARADVAAFELPVSGDGFSPKDETDVASDLKMLLSGSKLAGKNDSGVFSEIPSVHGSLREAVKFLHGKIRVELNSSVKVKKSNGGFINGKEKALIASVSPLAFSLKQMAEISLERSKLIIASIGDEGIRSKLEAIFSQCCVGLDGLKENFDLITGNSAKETDCVGFLNGVYNILIKFREILAWEAVLGFFSIETDDSIEKSLGETKSNGEGKKKKKKTLGKGSSVIFQVLRDRVVKGKNEGVESGNLSILVGFAKDFSEFFDPKDCGLEIFIAKIKEIVETNEVRRLPKIPKGTRDFGKEQMAIREKAFSIITSVFKMHGAVALDTPVFELRETLMGKYGEDSKLIYDLADQGGELCSLRYDLTVPFARYLAMNNTTSMKRYQIAKVYRRDNPSKGRYREFYQCDFDIAGNYDIMEPDFEVLVVLTQLLDRLDIGDFEIKLNHRKLLDGMMDICGVPPEKFRTVCSSIDKLDKQTFDQVKKELVEEKGISEQTADKIGLIVKKRGDPFAILQELKGQNSEFLTNPGSVTALNELEILFNALEKAKCLDKLVFDLSLARGLDYYTGVIYEAVFKGSTQVGSIAAGGRYDNLVGMFSGKQVPAVGVSLGIERVFTIMEQLEKDRNQVVRATETQVLVSILGKDLNLASSLVSELWNANIKAEFKLTKRVMNHINYAVQSGIPWIVIVGDSEVEKGIVKLKNVALNQEEEVKRESFVEVVKSRLG